MSSAASREEREALVDVAVPAPRPGALALGAVWLGVAAAWVGVAHLVVGGRPLITGPVETARAFVEAGPALWVDLAATLARALAGLGLGFVAGVALGLVTGGLARLTKAADGVLDFARSVPPVLVLPLFLLTLGYSDAARVLTVATGVSVIVAAGVSTAMQAKASGRREQLRLAGASWWQVLRWTQPFEALPPLLVSTRVAAAMAIVIATVTELVAPAASGIGVRVIGAQIAGNTGELTACLLAIGLAGWLVGWPLTRLHRRLRGA
ncbi:MAG: ABC transporter permease subunit [Myxococcus sp.]|nr:ABC transporter permease subunit [Myxococcus sp.]